MTVEKRSLGWFDPGGLSALSWNACQPINHSTADNARLPHNATLS